MTPTPTPESAAARVPARAARCCPGAGPAGSSRIRAIVERLLSDDATDSRYSATQARRRQTTSADTPRSRALTVSASPSAGSILKSVTRSDTEDLPTLRQWLDGLDDHPLLWFFEPRRELHPMVEYAWWRNPILMAVEETLLHLERAQPVGLGKKRREFRTFKGKNNDGVESLDPLRSELIVGSLLAEAGVPFRFNTSAGPDILLGAAVTSFAIEIGMRRPKSLSELSRRLMRGLKQRGLPHAVSISTDPIPPVAIRTAVQDAIVEQFLPADGSRGVTSLRTIAAPARPELGIPDSWVTIRVSNDRGTTSTEAPWKSPHMKAVAQEVAKNILRDNRKQTQAKSCPTILIADLTGGDLPDTRYWNDVFDSIWQPDDGYLAVAAMTWLNTNRMPTLAFSLNPFADQGSVRDVASLLEPVPGFHDLGDRLAGRKRRQ